jgi:hypothetical protein
MSPKRRLLTSVLFALFLTVFISTSAFAHYCTNPNKKDGAGSVGIYNIMTGTFEPSKRVNATMSNGGFITFTDGDFAFDIFAHQLLPEGALEAGPEGDNQCDGMGIDSALACLGITP